MATVENMFDMHFELKIQHYSINRAYPTIIFEILNQICLRFGVNIIAIFLYASFKIL
jgi:predicted TIM-barrel enzyme